MIELILAFFLSLWPNHAHTNANHNNGVQVTAQDGSTDTGGETEPIPPTPPPPKP
ncbi:hypothetical protein [Niabella aurantiaca]|uniref:hypothetical protein n=1 Tax=Niabella aurantiaca TaxID=379900 RepID=UPI0003770094|nr:hypothetical protein [Niabella aurantiaca]